MNSWERVIQNEVIKLKSFDGSVIPNLKVPDTYKKWKFGCRKLLKLWYRIEQHNLHWTPLVNTLKQISQYYLDLRRRYWVYICDDPFANAVYNSELMRLVSQTYKTSTNIIVDKERFREEKQCAICQTPLVYPAYICYRNGNGKIERKSRPIGIMCLNSSLSRFQKLVSAKEFAALLKTVGKTINTAPVNVDNTEEDLDILLSMNKDKLNGVARERIDAVMFANMFVHKDKVKQLKEKLK